MVALELLWRFCGSIGTIVDIVLLYWNYLGDCVVVLELFGRLCCSIGTTCSFLLCTDSFIRQLFKF